MWPPGFLGNDSELKSANLSHPPTISNNCTRLLIGRNVIFLHCVWKLRSPLPLAPAAQQGQSDNKQKEGHSTGHPHRITECLGLEGTSVGHPAQPPYRSRVTYSRLHRTLSRRVWNISRGGDSTTSLGSLGQGSVTLRGKKFFLMFRRNFLCFSLCLLPLVLSAIKSQLQQESGKPCHVALSPASIRDKVKTSTSCHKKCCSTRL